MGRRSIPVGDAGTLLARLRAEAGAEGTVLVGFDSPIGLPAPYAARAGVDDFLALLPRPDRPRDDWACFYDVAERPEEIDLRLPFYPRRPGSTRRDHLLTALKLDKADDLRRRCERAHPERRAASPLFWTLGAQQVGIAIAITASRKASRRSVVRPRVVERSSRSVPIEPPKCRVPSAECRGKAGPRHIVPPSP